MHVFMQIYMQVSIYLHMYELRLCMYICRCVYIFMEVFRYGCMCKQVSIYVCIGVCMNVFIVLCRNICLYSCIKHISLNLSITVSENNCRF